MAMKYRKKPVVVEAIQWTGKNLQELKNFVGDSLEYDVMDAAWEVGKGPVIVNVRIQTLEGIHHASVGDFIIKGIRGGFYPCKPDIFAKTYESASLTPPNEVPPCYQPDGDGCAYQCYDGDDETIDKCKECPLCYSDKQRHHAPPNEPLTLEQLREMDGEPVWFDTIKRWGIVKVCRDGVFVLFQGIAIA